MYVIGEEGLVCAPSRGRGIKKGKYRSKFEAIVADQLDKSGVPYEYEGDHCELFFVEPAKVRRYIPDILLLNSGIFIEVKGLLTLDDRKKMLLVKEAYPELDIRFLFMRSANKIAKKSKTSYADWCKKHGFPFADLQVPADWLRWAKTKKEKKLIADVLKNMSKELAIERYKQNYNEF